MGEFDGLSASSGQLALRFRSREGFSFDQFVEGPNRAVVAALKALAIGDAGDRVFLAGAPTTGKSHLLHAACELSSSRQCRVSYLPIRELGAHLPELFDSLATGDLVCLDDVDGAAGRREREIALLTLFDESAAHGARIVSTARNVPSAIPFVLPDLASRLSTAAVYRLTPLDDGGRTAVLRAKAAARGLELPDEVVTFILTRSRRDLRSLLDLLDRLDGLSLAEQRRLTVPFVREVIG